MITKKPMLLVAMLCAISSSLFACSESEMTPDKSAEDMIVIAHRGASGERPEHTLASYELAIAQGADFVEPDLVMTKDGVLVCRHENEISGTTDVADHSEFADRKVTKTIDGRDMTGWFTEDFTLAELKTLRAKERLPQLRAGNAKFDGQFEVPTFAELLALVKEKEEETGRQIGIYPETKHPTHFQSVGLPLEEALVKQLLEAGYEGEDAPIFIQSFEAGNLKALNKITDIRLVQLLTEEHGPPDAPDLSVADMVSKGGLRAIAAYADGLGPSKNLIFGRNEDGSLGAETSLVSDAHEAGLVVHPWTFRAENYFLPLSLRKGEKLQDHGDLAAEIRLFKAAGVDGVFSDFPGAAVEVNRSPKKD